MNRKDDMVFFFAWIGLGIFIMVASYQLRLGSFAKPGPGLAPFLAAGLLFLISIFMAARSFVKIQPGNDTEKEVASSEVSFGKD